MVRKRFRWLIVVGLVMGLGSAANAVMITVDPDAFGVGTNISSAFPGVTLSSVGPGFDGDYDPNIFSINPMAYAEPYSASTGSLVFGTNDQLFPHLFGGYGDASFRANFATPTSLVYLDGIGNNGSDYAQLYAYDSGGTLVDTYYTGQLTTSSFETMSVSWAGGIAYVLASGTYGDSVGFDHLRYEGAVVPEPSTLTLFGIGLAGLVSAARRRKAA